MNIYLLLSLLAAVGGASLWLGYRASAGVNTQDDYFLGGRQMTWLPLALTLLATQVGGGTILGAAEEAYTRGWVVLLYALGTCLGLLLLSSGYGARLREFGIATLSELLEKRYGSKSLRKVSAVISIAALSLILVGQGIATLKFFVTLGLDSTVLFVLLWAVIVVYTVMGGLRAVLFTDVLQVLCIIAAFAAVALVLVWSGPTQVLSPAVDVAPTTPVPWSAWLCSPLLFVLIEQDMGQRCFAAKSPRTVTKATAVAAVAMFIVALLPVYLGVLARGLGIAAPQGGSVLLAVVTETTNPVIATCFSVALLMAIVSTADSLLCSISSNVSIDLLQGSEGSMSGVRKAQLITLVIGLSTLGAAFLWDNVVTMLVFAYGLAASALVVPVVMAVYSKNPSLRGAWAALIAGGISYACLRASGSTLPWELTSVMISGGSYTLCKLTQQSRESLTPVENRETAS